MTVDHFPYFDENVRTIFNAWKELGFKEIDYNAGKTQIGTSMLQFNTIHGTHQSANGAYIRPIRGKRQNLTIMTKAQVTRILIEQMTKHAHGVEFINYKTNKLQVNIWLMLVKCLAIRGTEVIIMIIFLNCRELMLAKRL